MTTGRINQVILAQESRSKEKKVKEEERIAPKRPT
jgi:hypothetical protein